MLPNDKIEYRYNEEKDKTFSPFGDLVGIQDVIINGKLYEDGDDILVKDSFESKWILGKFCYAHDNEVYAITEHNRNPISWRYAASRNSCIGFYIDKSAYSPDRYNERFK